MGETDSGSKTVGSAQEQLDLNPSISVGISKSPEVSSWLLAETGYVAARSP